MTINPFNTDSNFYPFRWFFIIALGVMGWLAYANMNGQRIFYNSSQQQWSASGPGYHK